MAELYLPLSKLRSLTLYPSPNDGFLTLSLVACLQSVNQPITLGTPHHGAHPRAELCLAAQYSRRWPGAANDKGNARTLVMLLEGHFCVVQPMCLSG